MIVLRLIAIIALVIGIPSVAVAQQPAAIAQAAKPSPDQVKAAIKNSLMSVGLTRHQKMQIKSMINNYQSQTANADDATKQSAQKALLKNIYGVLTPAQQTQFKASMKQQLGTDISGS
jgi:Spy/CpxP family protein refolding chaperone